jgi:hypothetical protein
LVGLQLRLEASFTPEEMAAMRALYNDTLTDPKAREREGRSIFCKDERGTVYHTYSCYDRGNDKLNLYYHYLDLVHFQPSFGNLSCLGGGLALSQRLFAASLSSFMNLSDIFRGASSTCIGANTIRSGGNCINSNALA